MKYKEYRNNRIAKRPKRAKMVEVLRQLREYGSHVETATNTETITYYWNFKPKE